MMRVGGASVSSSSKWHVAYQTVGVIVVRRVRRLRVSTAATALVQSIAATARTTSRNTTTVTTLTGGVTAVVAAAVTRTAKVAVAGTDVAAATAATCAGATARNRLLSARYGGGRLWRRQPDVSVVAAVKEESSNTCVRPFSCQNQMTTTTTASKQDSNKDSKKQQRLGVLSLWVCWLFLCVVFVRSCVLGLTKLLVFASV